MSYAMEQPQKKRMQTPIKAAAKSADIKLLYLWRLVLSRRIGSRATHHGVYVDVGELMQYLKANNIEYVKNRVSHKKRLRAK